MIFPHSRTLWISLLAALVTASSLSLQSKAQAVPAQSRETSQRSLSNSVILRGGTHAQTMQRLHVVRQYALPALRSNPRAILGQSQLDFTPILSNPRALPNLALRLHALPQHVQVREDSSDISEVDQGLVIHHLLSYQILPGKCADAGARAQLAGAGASCFTRSTTAQRVAEFGAPGSPRYIADPGKRQAAVASFQRNSAAADADASRQIATLRRMLADAAQRAQIVTKIGQAEASRLSTLSDDDLKDELINSGVHHYEETMFVPKLESANYAHPPTKLAIGASPAEISATQQLMRNGVSGGSVPGFPKLLKIVPSSALHLSGNGPSRGDQTAGLNMGPYYFLTGFTISHDYEWQWGDTITIDWCVVGCSSTYGIQLHAGFNYAFGLRFPIQANLKYETVVHPNNSAEAKLTPQFVPIQGDVSSFFEAGMPADQMYDAKEIVAQVGADAGFNVSLPGLDANNGFEVNVDFTKSLPPPFTGGYFQPPAPGTHGIDSDIVFNGIDLLGGLLDFGFVGGTVYPAVQVNLHSDKLNFMLNDELQHRSTEISSGQTVSLGDATSQGGDYSHFSVGNPVYNLGFTVTPGLAPTAFVDIAVWSDSWQWKVWFPQLAVSLPPSGVDFSCHAGTTCVVDFQPVFNAATGQVADMSRERDAADRTLSGGGCRRNGSEGNYLCPVNGMYGLCEAMMKNSAVLSCGVLVPTVVDQILRRGACSQQGDSGTYVCPSGMMGLCNQYVKNKEILSCKQK
jgi:hypothetical protein